MAIRVENRAKSLSMAVPFILLSSEDFFKKKRGKKVPKSVLQVPPWIYSLALILEQLAWLLSPVWYFFPHTLSFSLYT